MSLSGVKVLTPMKCIYTIYKITPNPDEPSKEELQIRDAIASLLGTNALRWAEHYALINDKEVLKNHLRAKGSLSLYQPSKDEPALHILIKQTVTWKLSDYHPSKTKTVEQMFRDWFEDYRNQNGKVFEAYAWSKEINKNHKGLFYWLRKFLQIESIQTNYLPLDDTRAREDGECIPLTQKRLKLLLENAQAQIDLYWLVTSTEQARIEYLLETSGDKRLLSKVAWDPGPHSQQKYSVGLQNRSQNLLIYCVINEKSTRTVRSAYEEWCKRQNADIAKVDSSNIEDFSPVIEEHIKRKQRALKYSQIIMQSFQVSEAFKTTQTKNPEVIKALSFLSHNYAIEQRFHEICLAQVDNKVARVKELLKQYGKQAKYKEGENCFQHAATFMVSFGGRIKHLTKSGTVQEAFQKQRISCDDQKQQTQMLAKFDQQYTIFQSTFLDFNVILHKLGKGKGHVAFFLKQERSGVSSGNLSESKK